MSDLLLAGMAFTVGLAAGGTLVLIFTGGPGVDTDADAASWARFRTAEYDAERTRLAPLPYTEPDGWHRLEQLLYAAMVLGALAAQMRRRFDLTAPAAARPVPRHAARQDATIPERADQPAPAAAPPVTARPVRVPVQRNLPAAPVADRWECDTTGQPAPVAESLVNRPGWDRPSALTWLLVNEKAQVS